VFFGVGGRSEPMMSRHFGNTCPQERTARISVLISRRVKWPRERQYTAQSANLSTSGSRKKLFRRRERQLQRRFRP
jgi:hypothetical protein